MTLEAEPDDYYRLLVEQRNAALDQLVNSRAELIAALREIERLRTLLGLEEGS